MSDEFAARVSPLESAHFGLALARAEGVTAAAIPALLHFCEEHEADLVVARCGGRDLSACRGLVEAGMIRLEAQIAYEGKLPREAPAQAVRAATGRDAAAIAAIAREAFADMPSHYHADPRLPLEACREAYVDWSLRGLRGEAADAFFVAEVNGRAVGFMMFAKQDNRIRLLLSAIDLRHRGRGLYAALFSHGVAWGLEHGAERGLAITPHGNIAAQRNLIRLGLAPVSSTATFHGWRDRLGQGG